MAKVNIRAPADVPKGPDADLHDERRSPLSACRDALESVYLIACRDALESVYVGYSTLNLNPSARLRRFRCELQDYSDKAVISAWHGTARALAAATGAELHLHGADQLDTAPRIESIRRRAQPWEQPDHPNQEAPEETLPTPPSEIMILLEGPDGPMEVTIPETTATRKRLLEILKAMATEPHDK